MEDSDVETRPLKKNKTCASALRVLRDLSTPDAAPQNISDQKEDDHYRHLNKPVGRRILSHVELVNPSSKANEAIQSRISGEHRAVRGQRSNSTATEFSEEEGEENALNILGKQHDRVPGRKKSIRRPETSASGRGSLALDLPPLSDISEIFDDITKKALQLGLRQVIRHRKGQTLRVGTMCSGTESPLLALRHVNKCLQDTGEPSIRVEHVFSAEIEPVKQAYIERNFKPQHIFRDVRDFLEGSQPEGTTVYGQCIPVPSNVDILIVGSSCVDYSTLNNKPSVAGESNDTFSAVIAYARFAKPPILILENVIKEDAWTHFKKEFEKIEYAVQTVKVDTKDHYIPHTRQRKYMLCLEKGSYNSSAAELLKNWAELMEKFRRPASAPVTSFLLSSDDPRYLRLALGREFKDPSSKDWEACRRRHEHARAEHNLGPKHPVTTVYPEHSDRGWLQHRPQRDQDLLDIVHLRHAIEGVDSLYKTRPVDLSQNVDRVDRARWGITGCLTPKGSPFLTDQCRRLTGHEALKLQGLDIDSVSFTSETDSELRDLAGNAMSSTIVGSAILSALIVAYEKLPSREYMAIDDTSFLSPRTSQLCGADQLSSITKHTISSAPDWSKLLDDAAKSQRLCHCEGRTEISLHPILSCKDCHHTACRYCAGNPRHDYEVVTFQNYSRMWPSEFLRHWRNHFPTQLQLRSLPDFNVLLRKADDDIKADFLAIVGNSASEIFVLSEVKRERKWKLCYRSSAYRLELVLQNEPMWQLFAKPDRKLAAGSKLRRILRTPIAKRRVVHTSELFEIYRGWQWYLPNKQEKDVRIKYSDDIEPSWRNRLGLRNFQGETVPRMVHITVLEYNAPDEISGRYELRQECGTACASLYRKLGKDDMFFFLDPNPIGDASLDSFVFSTNPNRLSLNEYRHILAELNPQWRPWIDQCEARSITCEGYWVHCNDTLLVTANKPIDQAIPDIYSFDEFRGVQSCHDATTLIEAKAVVAIDVASRWNNAQYIDSHDKTFFRDFGWMVSGIPGLASLRDWRPFTCVIPTQPCDSCSPKPPPIKWLPIGGKWVLTEDHMAAALYERSIKCRPPSFAIQQNINASNVQVVIGVNLQSLAHQAVYRLPGVNRLEWNLDALYLDRTLAKFPPFRLQDNKSDTQHLPLAGFAPPLRCDQLRSLTWMKRQENGISFRLEEVEEALLPALSWKVEVKASKTTTVRGGILADEPSFGKTVISVGLVNEDFVWKEPKDVLAAFSQPNTGLINTAGTLIITPSHLTDQWLEELQRFCGSVEASEVVVIRNVAALRMITVETLCKAKVVIASWTLFMSEAYATQLALYAAYPPVSSVRGRDFKAWIEHAVPELPESARILQCKGIRDFREERLARLEARMDELVGDLPSKRFKGAKYHANKQRQSNTATPAKVDGVIAGHGGSNHWEMLQFPVLHLFRFNRLIVDEISYLVNKESGTKNFSYREYSPAFTSVVGLQAEKRWVLSGTPPLRDFFDVKRIALFLDINLGVDSFDPEAMNTENFKNLRDELSTVEKFRSYQENRSICWHERRHALAQSFLDRFARRNAADINSIPCIHSIEALRLDLDHSILHEELYCHLSLNNSDISDLVDNDGCEGTRIRGLVQGASSAGHALLQSCAFETPMQPNARVKSREGQLVEYVSRLERDIALIEALKDCINEYDKKQYFAWKSQSLGDSECDATKLEIQSKQKSILESSEDKGFRKCLDAVQVTGRGYTAQMRSIRRYRNVVQLQRGFLYCDNTWCTQKSRLVLIACGHAICESCLHSIKDSHCTVVGCAAQVLEPHVRSIEYFPKDHLKDGKKSFGAKLDAIVKLIKSMPENDQVLLFVQSKATSEDTHLVEAITRCLDQSSITSLALGDNSQNNLMVIKDFQQTTGSGAKKVLIMSLASEQASGLNLTKANHLILLSPFLTTSQYNYESTMVQAVRRIRRTGQTKRVFVYRFVALNTIDVDILESRERMLTHPIHSRGHTSVRSLPEPSREAKGSLEPSKIVRDEEGRFTLVPASLLHNGFRKDEDYSSKFAFGVECVEDFEAVDGNASAVED